MLKHIVANFLVRQMCSAFGRSYQIVNKSLLDFYNNHPTVRPLKILDLGCHEGLVTPKYLKNIEDREIYGLDCFDSISNKEIIYKKCDLESDTYPFKNNFFDIVLAGEVIEHLLNKDHLLEESYRVLKPGGIFICTTENIASLDNIVSLLLAQEPFSQHTGSKFYTSTFLSPHFMEKNPHAEGNKYLHKNVCSYFGLKRLMQINGFKHATVLSLGNISSLAEKLFPYHNRLLIGYDYK